MPLSVINKTIREKISKDLEDLDHTINQLDWNDIYRILHPATAEYTFVSSVWRTFTKTHNFLAHVIRQ